MLENMGMAMNIIGIITYLLSAWGLYMINKKLGNKYAWLSFIPLIQLISYKNAAGLSWKKILGWFFGVLIGLWILSVLSSFIFGITNASISLGSDTMFNNIETNSNIGNDLLTKNDVNNTIFNLISYIISFLALILPYLIIKYLISSGISKNTGRGGWSTLGLFFIPFIMLPIIGYKFKGLEKNKEEKVVEL